VWKLFPQLQVTVISLYSGWIPSFMAAVTWGRLKEKGAQCSDANPPPQEKTGSKADLSARRAGSG
jgi:hypothetical protein